MGFNCSSDFLCIPWASPLISLSSRVLQDRMELIAIQLCPPEAGANVFIYNKHILMHMTMPGNSNVPLSYYLILLQQLQSSGFASNQMAVGMKREVGKLIFRLFVKGLRILCPFRHLCKSPKKLMQVLQKNLLQSYF